jgi:hypothetical protein
VKIPSTYCDLISHAHMTAKQQDEIQVSYITSLFYDQLMMWVTVGKCIVLNWSGFWLLAHGQQFVSDTLLCPSTVLSHDQQDVSDISFQLVEGIFMLHGITNRKWVKLLVLWHFILSSTGSEWCSILSSLHITSCHTLQKVSNTFNAPASDLLYYEHRELVSLYFYLSLKKSLNVLSYRKWVAVPAMGFYSSLSSHNNRQWVTACIPLQGLLDLI